MSGAFGRALDPFLVPKNIMRHTVVTIDNLPRKKTAVQMWPVKPIGGEPARVTGNGEELKTSAGNYARYEPVRSRSGGTPTRAAGRDCINSITCCFKKSYVSLGYPDGYFNDRAGRGDRSSARYTGRAGPDQAQGAPERQLRVRRCRSSKNFRSGQKLLIRMGSANAAIVKDKLRELRKAIAKQEAAATDSARRRASLKTGASS